MAPCTPPARLPPDSAALSTTQDRTHTAAHISAQITPPLVSPEQRESSSENIANPSMPPTTRATTTSATTSPPSTLLDIATRQSVLFVPATCGPSSSTTTATTILDPSRSPFQPNSSTSGIQKNGGKAKTKTKSVTATTKEDIALEFSKVEINTVRARLKMLETKNKDLEFQNKLLLERVAILEKAEKENIYEKYFPMPGSKSGKEENPSASISHCNHHHSCCSRVYCCQSTSDHPGNPNQNQEKPAAITVDVFQKSINELQVNLEDLNLRFNKIESLLRLSNKDTEAGHHGRDNTNSVGSVMEVIHNEENHISEDFIVTIDENVDDLRDYDENYLNSTSPTNQLRKLRQ